MTRTALVLVAAVATASLAEAQTVESVDRLALLVNQGDRISVTARNGRKLQGAARRSLPYHALVAGR